MLSVLIEAQSILKNLKLLLRWRKGHVPFLHFEAKLHRCRYDIALCYFLKKPTHCRATISSVAY